MTPHEICTCGLPDCGHIRAVRRLLSGHGGEDPHKIVVVAPITARSHYDPMLRLHGDFTTRWIVAVPPKDASRYAGVSYKV